MFRRFRRRVLRWLALGAIAAAGVFYLVVNFAPHDPADWHVDPATIARSPTPNDFLAAPVGMTAARVDLEMAAIEEAPGDLLARFDAAVRAKPRVEVVAGSLDEGMVTYLQRTPVIGFPDYITVKAVGTEAGAALIVYSRSRFGSSDLGVNERRVTAWLAAIGN